MPYANLVNIFASHETGPAWAAQRTVTISPCEVSAFSCELIEIGRLDNRMPPVSGYEWVVLIAADDENIWFLFILRASGQTRKNL